MWKQNLIDYFLNLLSIYKRVAEKIFKNEKALVILIPLLLRESDGHVYKQHIHMYKS